MSADDQRFPLIISEGGRYEKRPYSGPGSDLVADKIRNIIGWRPRADDAKGFEAALRQTFTYVEDDDGNNEWVYTPHRYSIQAELGAITGAQASIYKRAQATINQAIPLLDNLESLGHEKDEDEGEAIRHIIRSRLHELVSELGREGGPRVVRVDSLFTSLLSPTWFDNGSTRISDIADESLYGRLQTYFHLSSDEINSIDDEHIVTNFITLIDYTISLANSWDQQRTAFRTSGNVFLGTQLVHVSRALDVVAESVHELYGLLDSVYIDAAEREIIELNIGGENDNLTLAGLLDWIDHFATKEGPDLIDDGGREGVQNAAITLSELSELTAQMREIGREDDATIPSGFFTERVEQGISNLLNHLEIARDWAIPIVADNNDEEEVVVVVEEPNDEDEIDPVVLEWFDKVGAHMERSEKRLSVLESDQDEVSEQLVAITEKLEELAEQVGNLKPPATKKASSRRKSSKVSS